ncbi:AAA family ATPase, partial [Arthrospira platensis SPKY1]|nr:AAA family ATPase [Arthrospira platensis SPKY1]
LGWLRNRVLRLTRDSNFSVLILLYGESGIGKTALLNAFVAETLERHKGTVVFFQPERAAGMLGVELFAESLFRSAHATPGPWGVAASRLGEQFAQQHANLLHSAAPASAAYSAKGVVPGVNTGERILAGDPHRLQLGVLCRDILLSMVDNVTSINGLSSQHLSLIFCFDQFSDYSPPVKQWLGSVLLRTLQQEERLASPKIV